MREKVISIKGVTGREGVVTDQNVADWIADPTWATANIALRAEGYITLDVDDYGDNKGAEQLATLEADLGILPSTITSTSRGQDSASRQHFYRIPDGVELVGSAATSIEVVQRHHRYSVVYPSIHPETGQPYIWYDYEGEPMDTLPLIDDFEILPDPWIEHLRVERPVYKHEQFEGPSAVAASLDEINQTNAIIRNLDGLPRTWSEGSGWHDTVFGSAAWLSRMVNSTAYVMDGNRALSILMEHTPVYPGWGQDKILEQWRSAVQVTAGQFADIPRQQIPQPMDFVTVANKLPETTPKGQIWLDVLSAYPEVQNDRGFWQLRHVILCDAIRCGLTDEEAVSLAYSARASMYLQVDENGLGKLWREVEKARAIVDRENGIVAAATSEVAPAATIEAPAPVPAPAKQAERPVLVTEEERAETRAVAWFGSQYMTFVNETLATVNGPYHRLNRWLILSLVFAPHVQFVKEGGLVVPCSIWGMTAGPSTSGKSESMAVMRTFLDGYFVGEDHPNIGGDATPEALIKHLILRDGKSSWFNSDEASAHIEASRPGTAGYLKNLREKLTELYDGRVPKILRNGDKELSDVDAKTYLTMQYAGIDTKIYDALEPSDWESGFLHRFVWAIGDRVPRTQEMKRKRFASADDVLNDRHFEMQKHCAAEWTSAVRAVHPEGQIGPSTLDVSEWVSDRDLEVYEFFERLIHGHPHEVLLQPSIERFTWSVMKCAGLVASSMSSTTVDRIHYLIALEQAEEWLANLLDIVGKTTQSAFRRDVDKLEKAIVARPSRRMKETEISRLAPDTFTAERWIQQLIADGRATRTRDNTTNENYIYLKEDGA